MNLVGAPIDRVDGRLKITGAARYAAEFDQPGMLHAVMVTSTIASGHIVAIDTAAAARLRGVVRVYTHENAPRVDAKKKGSGVDRNLPLLQDSVVYYDRQPIALVVADTFERATDAANRITVRYAPDEAATHIADAIEIYQPESLKGPDDPAHQRLGDAAAALAAAPVKVDNRYGTPIEHHNPMEPHATVAIWSGDTLTVYDATQGVFPTRKRLAEVFGLDPSAVRVVCPFVGGGFGCKGSAWAHTSLAAMAARDLKRPVKLVLSRPQMFSSVGYRPRTEQRVALGATKDGVLTALIHETTSITSAFDEFIEPSTEISKMLYAVPNITTSQTLARLNYATPTFTRAPGESSGSFALESAMDELSYALEIDPIELRLRNYAERDPLKNIPFSSKSLRACYRVAAEKFGWSARTPAPRSMRDGRALIGMGMATATYPTNRSEAAAYVRVAPDGNVLVQAGTQDLGTGAYTVFSQVAADALGVPVERVRFELGDTNFPPGPGSGGSQTTASMGSAVFAAATEARNKIVALATGDAASPLSGRDPASLVARDGGIGSADGSAHERYAAIFARHPGTVIEARSSSKPGEEKTTHAMHAFGAQFAAVRIDPDFGEIRLVKMISAFASGRILNAKTARSQYLGGMTWGVGMALLEATTPDLRTGRFVNANLADYLVPVNADIPPEFEAYIVPEEDDVVNPIGVKGIGEIGIVGAAAAIANAVYHATGTRVRELPIVPEKLF